MPIGRGIGRIEKRLEVSDLFLESLALFSLDLCSSVVCSDQTCRYFVLCLVELIEVHSEIERSLWLGFSVRMKEFGKAAATS